MKGLRFALPLAGFMLIALVLYIGVKNSPDRQNLRSVLIGRPAPEWSLPDLSNPGAMLTSAGLKGKPYVLNVWATWCAACRYEHQTLMDLSRQQEVPIIGLNWKDEDPLANEWLQRLGNPYAAIAVDKKGRVPIDYGVTAAPESFLVDANGIVQYRLAGPMTHSIWKREFEPRIAGKSVVAE
jgi:cytochrome c biogenesis protein CcmG, thiol:disulfide interchange protein DsbE